MASTTGSYVAGAPPAPTYTGSPPFSGGSKVFTSRFTGSILPSEWINLAGTRMNDADTLASNVSVHDGAVWLQMSDATQAGATGAYIGTNRNSVPGEGFLLLPGMYVEFDVLFPGNGSQFTGWAAVWSAGGGYPAGGGNFPSHGENDIAEVLGAGVLNYVFHGPNGQYGPNAYPGGYPGAVRRRYGLWRRRTSSSEFYLNGVKLGAIATDDDGAGQSLLANIGYASPAYGGVNQTGPASAVQIYAVDVWAEATGPSTSGSYVVGAVPPQAASTSGSYVVGAAPAAPAPSTSGSYVVGAVPPSASIGWGFPIVAPVAGAGDPLTDELSDSW